MTNEEEIISNKFNVSSKSSMTPERERWTNKYEYLLSIAGAIIGVGNFWRFPILCYQYGGGAFIIAYLTSLLFVGLPSLYLEQSLGQTFQCGFIDIWKIIMPSLKGIGYSTMILCFIIIMYW